MFMMFDTPRSRFVTVLSLERVDHTLIDYNHPGLDINGSEVDCGFLRITKEQVSSEDRFDTSWWRGGGAFIATIKST